MKQSLIIPMLVLVLIHAAPTHSQTSALLDSEILDVLTAETSGEMALNHFSCIIANYSGFAPSLGADKTAEYIADKCRGWGLTQVEIRRFASDGKRYFWAFRTEPWWEAKKADVWLIEPTRARIASFDAYRGHLARFSRSAQVEGELLYVGLGTRAKHCVTVQNEAITLTATEFKLLLILAQRKGRVQTRDMLLESVWGYDYMGFTRTVDTHMRRLRSKLGPCGECIETVRGVGYRIRELNL